MLFENGIEIEPFLKIVPQNGLQHCSKRVPRNVPPKVFVSNGVSKNGSSKYTSKTVPDLGNGITNKKEEMFFAAWAIPEKKQLGKTKADGKFAGLLELEPQETTFTFEFSFCAGGTRKKEKIEVAVACSFSKEAFRKSRVLNRSRSGPKI